MKKKIHRLSKNEDAKITAAAKSDPDSIPYTDEEWESVRPFLIRGPGRPPSLEPKVQVTLRLDQEVVSTLRATGPGWQTLANSILLRWSKRQHS